MTNKDIQKELNEQNKRLTAIYDSVSKYASIKAMIHIRKVIKINDTLINDLNKATLEEYTIVVDFGKPYTLKVLGKEAVKTEIARIDAINNGQEGDIKIYDSSGKEIKEEWL